MSKSDKKREERLAEALRANLRKRKASPSRALDEAQNKAAPES
jgi:hypothetical protein